jgi:lysophospholipase L1-like esterase
MPLRRLLVLLLLPLLIACDRGPRLAPLAADAVVLAYGDSLTYGTGAGENEAYPAVLAGLIGRRVINAGVPGETSDLGLARLPALLEEYRPALVILCHGGNDLLQRRSEADLAANLKGMVALARSAGAEVLLVAVPQPGLLLQSAPLYAAVAKELQLPCEAKALADILQKGSLKSDYIHPNAKGYALLAAALAERIPSGQR